MAELDEGPWVMGNVVGVDPDKTTMDLIGTKVTIGHQVHPGDQFSAGEMVAMTFSRVSQLKHRRKRKKLEARKKAEKSEQQSG